MYKQPSIQEGDLAAHIGKLKRTNVGPAVSPVSNPGNEYVQNFHSTAPLTSFAKNKPPPPSKPLNKPTKVPLPQLVDKTGQLPGKLQEKQLEKKPLEKPREKPRVPIRTDSNLNQFNLRKTGLREGSEEMNDADGAKKSIGKLDLNKFSSIKPVAIVNDSKPPVMVKKEVEKSESFPPPPPSLLETSHEEGEGDDIYDDVEGIGSSKVIATAPRPRTSSKPKISAKPSKPSKLVIPAPSVDLNNNSTKKVSELSHNHSYPNTESMRQPVGGYVEEDIYDDVESSHILPPASLESKSAAEVLQEEDIYDDVESPHHPSVSAYPSGNVLIEDDTYDDVLSPPGLQPGNNGINNVGHFVEDVYDDVDASTAPSVEAVEEEIYDDIDPADVLGPNAPDEVYDDVASPAAGGTLPYSMNVPPTNLRQEIPVKTFGPLDASRFVVPPGLSEWMLVTIAANPPVKPNLINPPVTTHSPIHAPVAQKKDNVDTSSIKSTESKDKVEKEKKKEMKKKEKEKKAREAQLKKDLKVFGVDACAERPVLGSVIATTEVKGTKKDLSYKHGDELNVIRTSHRCPTDKCLAQNMTTYRIGYISKEEFGLRNIDDVEPATLKRTVSLIPTNDSDDENDGGVGGPKEPPPVPNGPRPNTTLPPHSAPFVPAGPRRPGGDIPPQPPQPPQTLRTFQSQTGLPSHGVVMEELYDDVANGDGGELYDDIVNGGEIYEDIGEGLSTKKEFIQQEDIYDSIA